MERTKKVPDIETIISKRIKKESNPKSATLKRPLKNAGYHGYNGKIFCELCLVLDPLLQYKIDEPITKQQGYKENLSCSVCGKPLISVAYRKFLERVEGRGPYGKLNR